MQVASVIASFKQGMTIENSGDNPSAASNRPELTSEVLLIIVASANIIGS
jgi:hypothetical protein